MKKMTGVLTLLLSVPCWLQAQSGAFTLDGTITGKTSGYMYLYYGNDAGKRITDSARVEQGRFRFRGKLDGPSNATLATLRLERYGDDNNYTTLFLEPGALRISVAEGLVRDAVMEGSRTQQEYAQLNTDKKAVEKKYAGLLKALKEEKDHDKAGEIREQLEPYFNENAALDRQFILQHPDSYLSVWLMRFQVGSMTLDTARYYFNGITPAIRQTKEGKEIAAEITNLAMGSPGSTAADFSKKDINGTALRLGDFKGRYVLLDFWASWCVPCRKGNPHLLELYRTYKQKGAGLEIISISDDDSKPEAWRKAVDKDGIGVWKHVLRGLDMKKRMAGQSNPEDISDKYGIHSLPTQILIDPAGKIIGRYGGGGEPHEALDKKLAAVMGK